MTDKHRATYKPRPRPLDVVVTAGEPLMQISVYEQTTLICRRKGPRWTQYPVTPEALAQVLSRTPSASGLLPQNTLGVGRVHGQEFYVVYIPAAVRTLRMQQQEFTIPLPPLVWAGCGMDYRVWALDRKERPQRADVPLMVAPFPNCYKNGGVCWGSADGRPEASARTLLAVLKLFLEDSYFNLHVADHKSVQYPASVVARWQDLVARKAKRYPLDDLMPAEVHLSWLLGGGPWGAK
jgi:PRTRC genetic system protein B